MKIANALLDDLATRLAEREATHLLRKRRVVESPQGVHIRVDGQDLLNFCGNDYLGLANDARLKAAMVEAVDAWGVGSGASHLVCGHQAPHEVLEQRIAAFLGLPAALTFATGYMANLAVITALQGRGDAVFADKLNHASLNDACILSRADFQRFPHNDMAALARLLSASQAKRKMIVADAVFSMDGDLAPVAELLELAERFDAWLFLDDAHGFGVLGEGRGSLAHWRVSSPRIIYLATLGKAAGSSGAVVAGEAIMVDWLVNSAHSYIYTTAVPAALAAANLAAVAAIAADGGRRQRLAENIALFRMLLADAGLTLGASATAIQPLLLDSSAKALEISRSLMARGFWVAAIRPPTVPTPRLRITLSAAHDAAQITALAQALRELA